jgi:hypothetical protein
VRQVDRSHPSVPALTLEPVTVSQSGLEPFQGLGQRDLPSGGISRLSPGALGRFPKLVSSPVEQAARIPDHHAMGPRPGQPAAAGLR